MALPRQIREQSEAVKDLYKQINPEPKDGDSADPASVNDPAPVTDPVDPAADLAADSDGDAKASSVKEQSSEDPNSESYLQKWRTLQGMYSAEVPRLQSSVKESNERIAQLEELLANLSPANTPTEAAPSGPLVTEEDVSEYGDSIEVMRKVSKEEVGPVFTRLRQIEDVVNQIAASLNTSIVPQVSQLGKQQAASQEERFWSSLTSLVPDWQQVNNSPEFQSWLLEVDPLTGTTRQSYLEGAQKSLNAHRVAAFFNTYSGVTGSEPHASAQPNRSAQATELEKQVAPGKSRSASAPTGQNQKTYTRADIAKFFDDVRARKYVGRDAERNRIERDIFAAQQEGRVNA